MSWLFTTLLSSRRIMKMLDMVGMKKRRNNRSLMLSIIGLGLGAAVMSMMRGRNMNNMIDPMKEAVGDMDFQNPIG